MTERVNKTVLANGVRVLSLSMEHVRSVSMGVWVSVGARDEAAHESGLSHMIEHMIFKGTGRRSAYQIAKEFDAIGGHTNAFTTMESTCYHAKVMDSHLEPMVDILADIFLNSLFLEEELARERPVILQEIGMVEDNPDEYVHLLCSRTAWGDDPLGRSILGTRETVAGFDAEGLQAFLRQRYGPQRIVVAAAGHIEHQQLLDLVRLAFEQVPAMAPATARVTPECRSGVAAYPRSLEQVHMCLSTPGLSLVDPRRYTCALLNTIVGGNMSSRLFQEIRERRGLAYAIYSFATAYADTGMFGVYAGVDPRNVAQTVELCLEPLAQLGRERVTAAELAEAKEFAKGSLLLSLESSDNQMVRLAQNEITFGTFVPVERVLAQIDAVTADELCGLAQDLFQPQRFALTLLGPLPETLDASRLLPH